MGKNLLIQALRENDPKSDLFNSDSSVTSYKTGFPVLDYYLGYKVSVFDKNDEVVEQYNSIGIADGCLVMLIGKTSTGKTTFAAQIAANIVRPFDNGFVQHFDIEQAQNYSRICAITKLKMSDIDAGKYILKNGRQSIDEIKEAIVKIWKEKVSNPSIYKYSTGKKNEFNEEVELFQPTVVIIDSIPMLSVRLNENDKKDYVKLEDLSSQTDQMRQAGEITRFYRDIIPLCKEANIIVISINQIKDKPQVGLVHKPSDIFYLSADEALPGGKAAQYLSNYLIKFVAVGSEKFAAEDDGFDGFGVNMLIVKSRTNQAGQVVHTIYDKVRGFDSIRTSIQYGKDLGLVGGNKNGMYFSSDKDKKWISSSLHDDFKNDRELYKVMYKNIIPCLEERLSTLNSDEMENIDEELDY